MPMQTMLATMTAQDVPMRPTSSQARVKFTKKQAQRRQKAMFRTTATWVPVWKEQRDYISPYRGRFEDDKPNEGTRRDQKILSGVSTIMAGVLAAGLQAGLTSPAMDWFKLGAPYASVSEIPEVKGWLSEVHEIIMDIFSKSNIYDTLFNIYDEIIPFGTAAALIEEDYETVIRGVPLTIGEFALGLDSRRRVNSLCRFIWMTAEQMIEHFGKDACSDAVKSAYENGNDDQLFKVWHLIEPNVNRDTGKLDAANMPYRSVYWEDSSQNDAFLRESGYPSFRVLAPRWIVVSSNIYGIGPGHVALPDTKQIQVMEKDKLRAGQKVIDPPMMAPYALRQTGVNSLPGGVTFIDSAHPNDSSLRPQYQINPNFEAIKMLIDDKREFIKQVFYADILLMLAMGDIKNMTATEVAERHQEKMLMLGPILERLYNELLKPLIEITYEIAMSFGMIPPPPAIPELQGLDVKVTFVSLLAQAQKMVGTPAFEQAMGFVGSLAPLFPNVLDLPDVDEIVRRYFDMVNMPPTTLNADKVVGAIRQAKEQAQQQAQMMQSGLAMAQGAKVLADADTGTNNALTALMGGPIQ
jgi:hypothetical protein